MEENNIDDRKWNAFCGEKENTHFDRVRRTGTNDVSHN